MMGEWPGPVGVVVEAALALTAPASEPAIMAAVAIPMANLRMNYLPQDWVSELGVPNLRQLGCPKRQFELFVHLCFGCAICE